MKLNEIAGEVNHIRSKVDFLVSVGASEAGLLSRLRDDFTAMDKLHSAVIAKQANKIAALEQHARRQDAALKTAAHCQSQLADIVAKLQHRLEQLESASTDRYDRFIIPLEN